MTTPAHPADLNAWLRWVLDQREAEARLLCSLAGVSGTYLRDLLAEVDAKRRILDEHYGGVTEGHCSVCCEGLWESSAIYLPCPTVRLLAIPYAGRPGYRSEWAPA